MSLWLKILPRSWQANLSDRPALIRFLANTGWLFFDRILRLGTTLLVGVAIARYLGPDQYGLYSFGIAFAAIFSGLATLGIDSLVIRDVVSKPESADAILGTAFWLKLAAGAVTMLMAIAFIVVVRPGEPVLHGFVAVMAVAQLFQAFDTVALWFQSQTSSKHVVLAKNGAFLVSSALRIGLVVGGGSLMAFAWVGLLELALSAVGLAFAYRKTGASLRRWRYDPPIAVGLLKNGWPLLVAFMSYLLYSRVDQLIIGKLLDDHAVGIYAVSARLCEIPLSFVVLIAGSMYPRLTQLYDESRERFYAVCEQATVWLTLSGVGLLLLALLFGERLIVLVFGQSYQASGPVFTLQVLGMLFVFNATLRSAYLTITSQQRLLMVTTVASAFLNVAVNFALIPWFGVKGAAMASALTQAVSLCLLNAAFPGTRRYFYVQLRALLLVPGLRRLMTGRISRVSTL